MGVSIDPQTGAVTVGAGNVTATGNNTWPTGPLAGSGTQQGNVTVVNTPPPSVFRELDYHHAYMLATLPRKGRERPASTALGCTLTAIIPATIALFQAVKIKPTLSFSLDFVGLLEVLLFFGCLVWYIVEKINEEEAITATEYLDKLVSGTISGSGMPRSAQLRRRRLLRLF